MSEGSVFHGSHDDHGASTAAWVGVCGLIVASAVIAAGVWFNTGIITAIGVGMAVLVLVVAAGLAKAGYGVEAKRAQMAQQREARTRTGLRRS